MLGSNIMPSVRAHSKNYVTRDKWVGLNFEKNIGVPQTFRLEWAVATPLLHILRVQVGSDVTINTRVYIA